MKMLPMKFYAHRARVFFGLMGFCMLAYLVVRLFAALS